jgi:hypothetical protein
MASPRTGRSASNTTNLFMQDMTLNFTTPAGVLFQTDRNRQDLDLVTARVNFLAARSSPVTDFPFNLRQT